METKNKSESDFIEVETIRKTFNHVIDYIMAKRVGNNGRTEYLVKWEGWHARDATWEPESNFASAQVAEIFEAGLRQQMGSTLSQSKSAKSKRQSDKASASNTPSTSKSTPKRKNNFPPETMASKIFDKLKMKGKNRRRRRKNGTKVQSELISAETLFDVDLKIQKVIKNYEKLVGASKRKSSRMSCPSSPPKPVQPSCPKSPSLREQRYKLREQTKTNPSTDRSLNDSCGSFESNTGLEENKNPFESSVEFGQKESNLKTLQRRKSRTNKKLEIKVNNDSNKMISKTPNQSIKDNQLSNKSIEETPSKKFLNKVRQRFSDKPLLYDEFLSSVIEYNARNVELTHMLADNDELVDSFFGILYINRHHMLRPDFDDSALPQSEPLTDQEIDQRIKLWLEQLSSTLTYEQQIRFWNFISEKDKEEVVKASPDFFWLKVNDLFKGHKDLSEEFKAFMPNFCRSIYQKYWNQNTQ